MNPIIRNVWKTLVVALVAVLAQLLIGALLFPVFGDVWSDAPGMSETLAPMVAATLLTIAVLVYPITRSRLRGGRLFIALFLLIFGLNVFLTNIEALIFLTLSTLQLWSGVAYGTLKAVALSLVLVVAFGRGAAPASTDSLGPGITAGKLAGRLLTAALCYLILYFAAGLLILPHIQAFYDTQNMDLGPWFFPFQMLRGVLYVLFAWYFLRSILAPRWRVALATAAVFPILAGVADLLVPNAFMPEHIRHWHMLEIGWSNLVYGLLVGYLFWRDPRPPTR